MKIPKWIRPHTRAIVNEARAASRRADAAWRNVARLRCAELDAVANAAVADVADVADSSASRAATARALTEAERKRRLIDEATRLIILDAAKAYPWLREEEIGGRAASDLLWRNPRR